MSVTAKIKLDPSGFSAGAKVVEASLKGLTFAASKSGSLIAAALSKGFGAAVYLAKKAALGAAGGVTGLAAGVYEAMSTGGELVDLQEQTGVAIDTLMALRVAFEQAGLGADDVQPTIAKLQKAIVEAQTGGEAAAHAFDALGLSAGALAKMTADEQLVQVGDAIKEIRDPALKSAVAMEIFGKSGGRMLAFFAAGGLDDAREAIGRQATLMKQYADTFDSITDSFGLYHVKLRGFFVGVAAELAPLLKQLADWFKGLDFASLGESVGNTIATVYEVFQGGEIADLITTSLKIGFGEGINFLWSGLRATFVALSQLLRESFSGLTNYFSGFGKMLSAAASLFAAIIVQALGQVFFELRQLPGIGETFKTAALKIALSTEKQKLTAERQIQAGADAMSNALPTGDEFVAKMKRAGSAFVTEFKKSQGVRVIDTEKERESLNDIMQRGREAAADAQYLLDAKARPAEAPVMQRDIMDLLKPQEFKFSRAQQVFGQFGTLGGGVVRGTFQTFDPVVNQQKRTNEILNQIKTNTERGTVVAAPAYQR